MHPSILYATPSIGALCAREYIIQNVSDIHSRSYAVSLIEFCVRSADVEISDATNRPSSDAYILRRYINLAGWNNFSCSNQLRRNYSESLARTVWPAVTSDKRDSFPFFRPTEDRTSTREIEGTILPFIRSRASARSSRGSGKALFISSSLISRHFELQRAAGLLPPSLLSVSVFLSAPALSLALSASHASLRQFCTSRKVSQLVLELS